MIFFFQQFASTHLTISKNVYLNAYNIQITPILYLTIEEYKNIQEIYILMQQKEQNDWVGHHIFHILNILHFFFVDGHGHNLPNEKTQTINKPEKRISSLFIYNNCKNKYIKFVLY